MSFQTARAPVQNPGNIVPQKYAVANANVAGVIQIMCRTNILHRLITAPCTQIPACTLQKIPRPVDAVPLQCDCTAEIKASASIASKATGAETAIGSACSAPKRSHWVALCTGAAFMTAPNMIARMRKSYSSVSPPAACQSAKPPTFTTFVYPISTMVLPAKAA